MQHIYLQTSMNSNVRLGNRGRCLSFAVSILALALALLDPVLAVDDLSSFLKQQSVSNKIAPGVSAAVMKVNAKTGVSTLLAQGKLQSGDSKLLLGSDQTLTGE
jgi:hypothetical protein